MTETTPPDLPQDTAPPSNPFESPASTAPATTAVDIRAPGMFRRGRIIVPADLSASEVQAILEDKGGFVVYETALIGADLVIMRSDWTGLAVKVKSTAHGTEIYFNAFAPALWVRIFYALFGMIPLLILTFGAWKTFTNEFMTWVREEQPFDV